MKELNLTEGEWYINDLPDDGTTIETREFVICRNVLSGNAQAICKAVNNTYHKGIDPEGVPELVIESLRAYKSLWQRWFELASHDGAEYDEAEAIANKKTKGLKEALKKAGVPINEKAE